MQRRRHNDIHGASFDLRGAATNRNAVWTTHSASLNGHAGQPVRIRIEAADTSTPSLVEAALDDLRVTATT